MCFCNCWFSTTPERSSSGEQKWGTLCWGENCQDRSSDIFRSPFYEPNSYITSYLKSTEVLRDDSCPYVTDKAEKNVCSIDVFLLQQINLYTDLTPCLFGAVSQSYLKCSLLAYSLHFTPNKTTCNSLVLLIFLANNILSLGPTSAFQGYLFFPLLFIL